MQCFDTFRGFLHKIYAATMDGKGQEGTYNFFSRRLGGSRGGQGIGHRGQLPPTPLAPPMLLWDNDIGSRLLQVTFNQDCLTLPLKQTHAQCYS